MPNFFSMITMTVVMVGADVGSMPAVFTMMVVVMAEMVEMAVE